MLRSYLTSVPHTKFVLIEDSIKHQGKQICDFLINAHLNRSHTRVHYFVFHGSFLRAKTRYGGNVTVHDFTSNVCGWDNSDNKEDFEKVASRLGASDVVFVDSLVHAIFQYSLAETYRVLNILKTHIGVQQIIALLHTDLLVSKEKLIRCFEHLCTLSITIEPNFISGNGRAQYIYKKLGGKIVTQIEEYKFEDGDFITQKIDRLDSKTLLQNPVPEVAPDKLTTFRIGLNNQEVESRDVLALPYVYEAPENPTPGQIQYDYDKDDDFDEEDPDDDLNF